MVVKERRLKRIFDILVSGALLVILAPAFFTIAAIIKLQGFFNPAFKGPIFYREPRVSKGHIFQIYKFRIVTEEALKNIKKNCQKTSVSGFTVNKKYLTPLGRCLAKRYIDEIPQLINVFKGEMSIVGPRPHFVTDFYNGDLKRGMTSAKYIKAGLCGLIQASKGKSRMALFLARMARRKKAKDIGLFATKLYLRKYKNASAIEMLFLDIWIIYHSIIVFKRGKGLEGMQLEKTWGQTHIS